jgi:tRNA threonylcarbamoyl adenosine modification protein YjeE
MSDYQSKYQFTLKNESATCILASQLAGLAEPRDVIGLAGDLGAGKTAFARAFIIARGGDSEVPSPTFTLVQVYECSSINVYHFDLYRIEEPEEIFELGIEDAFAEGISLIEWPDRMDTYIPSERLDIIFSSGLDENAREVILVGYGDSWINRLAKVFV